MTGELLNQGIMLMLVGMGTVFVFLTILVIAMTIMSALAPQTPPAAAAPVAASEADEVAAVAAAVEHHRRVTGK